MVSIKVKTTGESAPFWEYMSTEEQIREVYEGDIAEQTKNVFNRSGCSPFYDNFNGFQIEGLFDGLGIDKVVCSEYYPKSKKRQRCL
jgi:hypothetical protein